MLFNIFVVVAAIAVLLVSAHASTVWTTADLAGVKGRADQIAHKSKSNQEIYHSFHFIEGDKKSYCDNIIQAGNSAASALELFFAYRNSELAGCQFASGKASNIAKTSLEVCDKEFSCC